MIFSQVKTRRPRRGRQENIRKTIPFCHFGGRIVNVGEVFVFILWRSFVSGRDAGPPDITTMIRSMGAGNVAAVSRVVWGKPHILRENCKNAQYFCDYAARPLIFMVLNYNELYFLLARTSGRAAKLLLSSAEESQNYWQNRR